MFKLMIVDDSPYIVQDLAQLIDWESFDFILTGSYTSAHTLLEDAKLDMPDLVIADISMPVMGGIELAKELYKLNPEIKIIFISSYSEFEYARQAVELHVFDYLLKPVQISNLTQVMNRLLNSLKEREQRRFNTMQEESQKTFYRRSALTHYFSRLLYHAGNEVAIKKQAQRLGLILPDAYQIYVVNLSPILPEEGYIYFTQATNFPNIQVFPLVPDAEYGTLLVLYHGGKLPLIADFLASFCVDVETQLGINLTVGYSTPAESFTELPKLFQQATQAISYQQRTSSNLNILSYKNIPENGSPSESGKQAMVFSEAVVTMRNFIHNNYMNEISTKKVAEAVYLSSNYANSMFVSQCGMTIFEYLTQYRIDKAKQLLSHTEELITRIAELVGYGNKTSFYLAFKRHVGMSPTEYRQRYTTY